jgi:hypothetical protein
MKVENRIGIWMDYSIAHLVEFSQTPFKVKTIESEFNHEEKEKKLAKGESFMHNKQQQLQSIYFKQISKEILKYDKVLLFGPTKAKLELYNVLRKDNRFDKIKIHVEDTNKMSLNQMQKIVNQHFTNPLYS